MLKINELQRLHLGVKGENLSKTIEIDMSAWAQIYPNGTADILHRRYGDQTKALTGATYDSDTMILSWTPTSYDTYYEGYGVAEIRMVEGNVVKKTKDLIVTAVCDSVIDGSGSVVASDYQAFLNSVLGYKNGAATAQTNAEAAQTAAETAQGKAEDAQAAAEAAAAEAASVIDVSTVAGAQATTLEPGSQATAEIQTISGAKKFVFGIPKGSKGDTGAAGQDGADGQDGTSAYLHIRYAASEPTQDSDMKTTPDKWIGIYTGSAGTAPTTYTSYTWYKFKGETGPVAGIKMNNSAVTVDANGIADLGTVITDVSGKVDKVPGKQLSTEDYTTAERNKLGAMSQLTKRTVPVALAVSDWSGSGSSWSATFLTAYVTTTSTEKLEMDTSVDTYAANVSSMSYEKKSGGGGIVVYANAKPTGTITGTLTVMDNDDGKLPVILEGTVTPIANGGTGQSSLAGVQSAFQIGDPSTLHTSTKTNLVAATNELCDQIATKLNNSGGSYTISLVSDTNFIGFDIRHTNTTGTYFRFNFFDTGKVTISRFANGAWQTEVTLRNAD